MAKLKVPSLQHLARNWRSDSGIICRDLVNLVRNPPIFNYKPIFSATTDLLHLRLPLSQIEEGIRRAEKRERVRANFLKILPLVDNHFRGVEPDFVNQVSTRRYPIGAGIDIPFTPPLVYGVGGKIYFPWFSFWRQNPLRDMNLRLFVTIVDEVLRDDPDLEDADFEILDFSVPKGGDERVLSVARADEIEHVSQAEKTDMLEVFADGYLKAKAVLEAEPTRAPDRPQDDDRDWDDMQPEFAF